MLALTGVSKAFGGAVALDNFSCAFQGGQIYGIAGANGSGKTVLLKLVAGFYAPSSGEMTLDGESYRPRTPAEALSAGVAYVPQVPYYPSFLSKRQLEVLVGFGLEPRLRQLGLADNAKQGPLSLADRQVAEVLLALARCPRVLLLDEPRFVFQEGNEEVWGAVRRLCQQTGTTTLVVLHDFTTMRERVDGLLYLNHGCVDSWVPSVRACPIEVERLGRALSVAGCLPRVAPKDAGSGRPRSFRLSRQSLHVPPHAAFGIYGGLDDAWEEDRHRILQSLLGARGTSAAVVAGHRADRGLAPDCTIADHLAVVLHREGKLGWLFRRDRLQRLAAQLLADADVKPNVPEILVRHLSGGNKQRLAFVCATIPIPDVLVLVNPWRGLDPDGIRRITVAALQGAGVAYQLVIVTDDTNEFDYFRQVIPTVSISSESQVWSGM